MTADGCGNFDLPVPAWVHSEPARHRVACRRELVRQALVRQAAAAGLHDRLVQPMRGPIRAGAVLFITVFIALAVVFIALAIGFPAAYILARRNFNAKPILLLLYLPAAAHPADDLRHPACHNPLQVWHRRHGPWRHSRRARADGAACRLHSDAVLRADQPESRMERLDARRQPLADFPPHPVAANGTRAFSPPAFWCSSTQSRISSLAFLLAGGGSQTLVVALYYNVFAGGVRPVYSIDAMAVIYMCVVMACCCSFALRAPDTDGIQARPELSRFM